MDSNEPQAIPFITVSKNKGFEVTREAEAFLATLEGKRLGVVSVAGKYRTGKSYLLNKLLGRRSEKRGFQVGPTVNSCTKGIWLWPQTLRSENPDEGDLELLVLDTEGFGGINENQNHDNRIFIFSLLLSSLFLYNSVGSIDETALQTLSLIVNLAKNIQLGEAPLPPAPDAKQISHSLVSDASIDVSHCRTQNVSALPEVSEEVLAEAFPFFLWVIRDFCLELKDAFGNPITAKAYFEGALRSTGQGGPADGKNKVRTLLKHFFRNRDCVTLVRPVERETDLQNLDRLEDVALRPEFVMQVKKMRKLVLMRAGAKKIRGAALDGPKLSHLARAYVQAVNSGAAPSVESAWQYIVQFENEKKLRSIYSRLRQSKSMVRNSVEIDTLIDSIFVDFEAEKIGSGEETDEVKKRFAAEVRQELEHDCSRFAESLKLAVRNKAEEKLDALKKAVLDMESIDSDALQKMTENAVQEIVSHFKSQGNETDVRSLVERAFAVGRSEVLQLALHQVERMGAREARALEAQKDEAERKLREANEQLNIRVEQVEKRSEENNQKMTELNRENQRLCTQLAQLKTERDEAVAALRDNQTKLEKLETLAAESKAEEIDKLTRQVETVTAQLAERDANAQKESVLLNGKLKYLETNLHKAKLELQARDADLADAKRRIADSDKLAEDLATKLQTQRTVVPDTHVLVERPKWSEMREKAAASDDLRENYEKVIREVIEERNMVQGQFEFLKENFELEKNKNFRLLHEIHDKIARGKTDQPAACQECTDRAKAAQNTTEREFTAAAANTATAADPPEIFVSGATVVKDGPGEGQSEPGVVYCIDVRQGSRNWTLQKRFRDLFDLAVKLRRGLKRVELPPSTKELWGFTRDIWSAAGSKSFPLEQRKMLVERVLRDLAALTPIRTSAPFQEFLREEQFKD